MGENIKNKESNLWNFTAHLFLLFFFFFLFYFQCNFSPITANRGKNRDFFFLSLFLFVLSVNDEKSIGFAIYFSHFLLTKVTVILFISLFMYFIPLHTVDLLFMHKNYGK